MDYKVVGVEFSGTTYQVEVWDSYAQASYWTFFQYSEEEILKDAFCSCEGEELCPHLKMAFLKISNHHAHPWHVRYKESFWFKIFKIFAFTFGYETSLLHKKTNDKYEVSNDLYFSIKASSEEGNNFFTSLLQNRKKETPENSLKFSNLSEEDIQKWKEGRPSSWLLFELSFWSDLAKKIFIYQEEKNPLFIEFQEDKEGFPCHIEMKTSDFNLSFKITKNDLLVLVPALNTIPSSLRLYHQENRVESIRYDSEKKMFFISHFSSESKLEEGIALGNYFFVKDKGFYPRVEKFDPLNLDEIKEENTARFLDLLAERNLFHLLKNPVHHEKKYPLQYHLAFDSSWNLHINAYLFQKDDAQFFDHYAYSENSFFLIESPIFYPFPTFIPAHQVSEFVTRNQAWLNQIPFFATHISPVESELFYRMDLKDKKMRIVSQPVVTLGKKSKASHDFGHWLYFQEIGFFPKEEKRLKSIPSGLEISFEEVGSFLRAYREELALFFLKENPFIKRGLHVGRYSSSSLFVKPEWEVKEEYKKSKILFFEEFIWVEDKGFFELPYGMRLPEGYRKEVIFSQGKSFVFFEEELPRLMPFVSYLDPLLQKAFDMKYHIESFSRDDSGRLHIDFSLTTNLGKISALEIYDAIHRKQTLHFSQAGALYVKDEIFEWLKNVTISDSKIELTPLQFLQLDAFFHFTSTSDDPALKNIREFSTFFSPPLKGFKSTLRPYQKQGLEWLFFLYQNHLSGLLCDDMGLGKTHQAMGLMASIINHKKPKNYLFLVVAPTSVIYHWQDKLKDFLPKVKIHLFHGSKRPKRFPKKGLVLTSYGILRIEKKKLAKARFDLAVFDEVQIAKNPHSQIHKILTDIPANMRLGMTGTPIENTLLELKALFDIILPGYMPKEKSYKEQFVNPIEKEGNVKKKELLARLIKPFVLRRRKKEVLEDLPEKSEDKTHCDLSPEQIDLYRSLLNNRKKEIVHEIEDHAKPVPYMHIFSLLTSLKQICNHPALFVKRPENYKDHISGKWNLFTELLNEAIDSDQKVVIFSQYLQMLDIFKYYLSEKGWDFAEIRGSTKDRGKEMEKFKNDSQCKVFLGSLQAAGLGIDLTAASIVILYDRWWNAARENQAIDRVHRMGQKWGVQVYKLITKDTIEEKIDSMITKKGKLMEEVVMIDDQETLKTFTRKELLDLLQFTL